MLFGKTSLKEGFGSFFVDIKKILETFGHSIKGIIGNIVNFITHPIRGLKAFFLQTIDNLSVIKNKIILAFEGVMSFFKGLSWESIFAGMKTALSTV